MEMGQIGQDVSIFDKFFINTRLQTKKPFFPFNETTKILFMDKSKNNQSSTADFCVYL